ncbi:MAG: hypothetical protein ACE5KA_01230 [Nitrososphaerales archaeon]
MDENLLKKEIETLLKDAENFLMHAKTRKGKDTKNFEAMLAWEYAIKVKNKSTSLKHLKVFYEGANRRTEIILDELKNLGLSFQRERSYEERKYDEGDVAGG